MSRPLCTLFLVAVVIANGLLTSVMYGAEGDDKELVLSAGATSEVGRLVKLTASSPTEIHWDVDEALAKEDEYYIDSRGKTIILPCPKEGRFKVTAFSVIDGKLHKKACYVTIGGKGTAPINPPIAKPAPNVPAAPNVFAVKLQTAYQQDVAAKQGDANEKRKMVQVYKQGRFIARNVRNKSADDVFSGLRDVASSQDLKDTTLGRTRQAIAEYLATKLNWQLDAALQQDQRELLATLLEEVYKTLESVQ